MTMQIIDIINGFLALIFIVISIIVGLIFFSKYRANKEKTLIYVGITWIIMSEPWWGHTVSFLFALFTGDGLTIQAIYFLSATFVPIGLTAWLAAFTNLVYKNKQKLILIIAIICQIIFEIIFLYVLFTNPSLIAISRSPVESINQPLILGYFLIVIAIFLLTGIKFTLVAMRSDKADTQLKGKILLIAILSYVIGAIWDGLVSSEGILSIGGRIILVFSAFGFYHGFILPDWLKKIFQKNK
ncbi:MAG: hypothetical protein ACFFAH_10895 [Promethearchaeota archaeon]